MILTPLQPHKEHKFNLPHQALLSVINSCAQFKYSGKVLRSYLDSNQSERIKMTDIWQAEKYLSFNEERTRPALDLLARVDQVNPKLIIDLGCGPGNSTLQLKQHWPSAQVIGVDNSAVMLAKAKEITNNIEWQHADIYNWHPTIPPNIIFANAVLQWLDNHNLLLPKLFNYLAPHGTFAIQMPRNYDQATHITIIEMVKNPKWKNKLSHLLRYDESEKSWPVHTPEFYYQLFEPLANKIDIWQTEYLTILAGENPVATWSEGTALRPFLSALNENERDLFINEYREKIAQIYRPTKSGKTLLPFRRIFIIASRE
jgi:trans-aconitate 2-methyltransferase